jgi:hypothetical protein
MGHNGSFEMRRGAGTNGRAALFFDGRILISFDVSTLVKYLGRESVIGAGRGPARTPLNTGLLSSDL